MNVSIVILNWNGLELLKECVPSVTKAAGVYADDCEVMVIDNGSSDKSREYLLDTFPEVKVLPLEENLSFTRAMNMGIREAGGEVVISLNNDTIVEKGFILPLVERFREDGALFAVGAKMLLGNNGTLNFGRAKADFSYGIFNRRIIDSLSPAHTLYACAGGFAFSKDKFLELGGFDEDIDVYWEDLDLCYRGWKRGWKTIYEPRSIIYHKLHGTNLKRLGQKGIDLLSGQNYSLFIIKNMHDKAFFLRQILLTPLFLLVLIFTGKLYFAGGILRSLRRWGLFLKKRKAEAGRSIISDREVFKLSREWAR
jgi:GT2 family glycosyltransferase